MNIKLLDQKPNSRTIEISDSKYPYLNFKLYFSYNTLIAIKDIDGKLRISENIWSNTTGKHLNLINRDKSIRIKRNEFEIISKAILNQLLIKVD